MVSLDLVVSAHHRDSNPAGSQLEALLQEFIQKPLGPTLPSLQAFPTPGLPLGRGVQRLRLLPAPVSTAPSNTVVSGVCRAAATHLGPGTHMGSAPQTPGPHLWAPVGPGYNSQSLLLLGKETAVEGKQLSIGGCGWESQPAESHLGSPGP